MSERLVPDCSRCAYTYFYGCPCGNSVNNAACLTLFTDISLWLGDSKEGKESNGNKED